MPLDLTPHYSQTILERIVTILSTATLDVYPTSAGANVEQGRVEPFEEGTETPFIAVFEGVDETIDDGGRNAVGFLDSVLTIHITLAAKPLDNVPAEKVVRIMRAQVHRALMADYTLGLAAEVPGVVQVWPSGAEEPTIGADGDRPTASLETLWSVHYRTSREDPA